MLITGTNTDKLLENLYIELDAVKIMSEAEVCECYNSDTKDEIIAAIEEEIDALEDNYNYLPDDDGMDYVQLQLSQGLPVVYW